MARPRKPTHLKIIAGTDRPDRRHKNEPTPKRKRLAPPAALPARTKSVWQKAVKVLDDMGILTVADSFALEAMCQAIADEYELRKSLAATVSVRLPSGRCEEDGTPILEEWTAPGGAQTYVTIGKSGPMLRMRPEVAAIADADRRVSMWLAKFGLTPADRSRIDVDAPPDVNSFAQF